MAARDLHAFQGADFAPAALVEVRPSHVRLVTSERPSMRSGVVLLNAFRRLLAPHGTASHLARCWECSPAYIGMLKSGERKLTEEHVAALPPALPDRFNRLAETPEPEQLSFKF